MRRKFVNLWALVELFRSNLTSTHFKNLNFSNAGNSRSPLDKGKDIIDTLIDDLMEIKEKYNQVEHEHMKAIFKRQMDVIQNRIDSMISDRYGIPEDDLHTII